MKIGPRKRRSDSSAAAIAAAQAAALGTIEPPAHVTLRPADRPFWEAIVQARARDSWNEVDLANAATMARAQADVERLQAELDAEGDVIEGKANPKHKLLETLARRVVALARVLHVHAEATQGRARDAANALDLERKARADPGDDLIPTLRVVQ
jgi:hypothetical protein